MNGTINRLEEDPKNFSVYNTIRTHQFSVETIKTLSLIRFTI